MSKNNTGLLFFAAILSLALGLLLCVINPIKEANELQALRQSVEDKLSQELYAPARTDLLSLVSQGEATIDDYYALRNCEIVLGIDDGISVLEDAISAGVYDEDLVLLLVDSYFAAGDYSDAFTLLKTQATVLSSTALSERYEEERYAVILTSAGYLEIKASSTKSLVLQSETSQKVVNYYWKVCVDGVYDSITPYDSSTGYAVAMEDGVPVLVDENGWVYKRGTLAITEVVWYAGGYAAVINTEGNYCLLNSNMSVVLEGKAYISCPYEGIFAVSNGTSWSLISTSGTVSDTTYEAIAIDDKHCYTSNGYYFAMQNGVYQLYNPDCELVNDQTYADAYPFVSNQYAAVSNGSKWGFVSGNGELKIDYQYDGAKSFAYSLAPVCVGTYWGYISSDGTLQIDTDYQDAVPLTLYGGGYVKKDGYWYLISLLEYR